MKIAFDIANAFTPRKTGIGAYTRGLVDSWLKDPSVLGQHSIWLFLRSDQKKYFPPNTLPLTWHLYPIDWPIFRTQVGLFWALKKIKPDLFFVPDSSIPLFYSGRSVFVLHGMELLDYPTCYPLISGSLNRFLLKSSLKRATGVVAVSNTSLQKAKLFLRPNIQSKVIYQGLTTPSIIHEPKNIHSSFDSELKSSIDFSTINPYLLYLGTLEKRKNLLPLIGAFEIIKPKYPNLKLVLAGPFGFGFKAIKKNIRFSSFRKSILIYPTVSEDSKNRLIKEAEALISPSLAEGFGRTIGEALILKKKVLASNLPVFRELYADAPILLNLVKPNSQGLAKGINRILSSSVSPQTAIAEAQKIHQKYSWSKVGLRTARFLLSFDKI